MQIGDKLQTLWSNDYGRYLVAACDIPEKTIILLENAALHAPADNVKDKFAGKTNLCLVCCHPSERRCTACGWCICSTYCEKMQCHYNECTLFAKNEAKFPPPHTWPISNKTILVLRCLLMKIHGKREWTDFLSKLEHHSSARSTKSTCNKSDAMIVENIQYFYPRGECPFTEMEIRTVCGIINVNAFFAENIDELPVWRAKCMFETGSLFAHSCSPNCSWSIALKQNGLISRTKHPDIQIEVVTAAPIKKGEMLTIFYSTRYALYGTLKRIVLMEEIAHFQCKCSRCSDKTEMDTFMSAVKCLDCEKGYLLPECPLEVQSDWKCLNCGCTQNVTEIVCRVCGIEVRVEKIKGLSLSVHDELKLLVTVAQKASANILHENHYVLQEIATRIIELLVEDGILNVSDSSPNTVTNLQLFVTQCKYLLNIGHTLLSAMTGYIGKLVLCSRIYERQQKQGFRFTVKIFNCVDGDRSTARQIRTSSCIQWTLKFE